MNDERELTQSEKLSLAFRLIEITPPGELHWFEPTDTGDADEDGFMNPRARVRALLSADCDEELMPFNYVLTVCENYTVGGIEGVRKVFRAALENEEFEPDVSEPEAIDPESIGFLFLKRSDFLRVVTRRTGLTVGYLCEILTDRDTARDSRPGFSFGAGKSRDNSEMTDELHLPAWFLAEALAAAKQKYLRVSSVSETRIRWTAPEPEFDEEAI
ncbi:MAG: hypothetical protein KY459_01495 [Acidobacteria bacterium]|nr:hypothetical protein [Acidobacteriota bacterium]